jgi:chitin deacetylase
MPRKKQTHHHNWKKDFSIAAGATVVVVAISSLLISSHSFQIMGSYTSHVDTNDKVVALTFDDGPLDEHIDEVLDTLTANDVKATFYLIGKEIDAHPAAMKKLATSGHEIGNHGYTHRSLIFLPYRTIANEIELTDESIRASGYTGPITFRPPYGHKYIGLPYYLAAHNRETVLWSLNPDDSFTDAEDMSAYVEDSVLPGDIIILHVMEDHRKEQRKALKTIIPALKKQGYQFVTVSELLRRR